MIQKDTDLLAAIGSVTVCFAALEFDLMWVAGLLVGGNDPGVNSCVTADLSFAKLVKLVSSLHVVRENDPAIIEELAIILKQASKVEQSRNIITHSNWGWHDTPTNHVRMKVISKQSKRVRWDVEQMDAAKVTAIAKSINAVSVELHAFMQKQKYNFSSKLRQD
jgi:hypothetical protein